MVYHIASIEKGSELLAPISTRGGILYLLVQSTIPSIRSNAASTISKLAFKAKALEESSSETSYLLNVSLDIIKAYTTKSPLNDMSELGLVSFSSHDNVYTSSKPKTAVSSTKNNGGFASTTGDSSIQSEQASLDRAVEVVASMIGQSIIKEELVHGSYRFAPSLPYILSIPLTEYAYTSTIAYGIAHIICAISVTNIELHKEQLAEKGITIEQYNEMQELQRIKAKDDNGKVFEEAKSVGDSDTVVMCLSRIKKLVDMRAVLALVK